MSSSDEKRVYRNSEPVFYEHLESLLEAGFSEIEEDTQLYRVKLVRGDNWVTYFVLRPVFTHGVWLREHRSRIEA